MKLRILSLFIILVLFSCSAKITRIQYEKPQKTTSLEDCKIYLVGDDLFTTNTKRLYRGIKLGAGNAWLLKVNQIWQFINCVMVLYYMYISLV